ncbi:hypothetical protein JTY60_00605 [symbiont of Argiope bruennichi]|uniref:hypothetical protein n=1 Tax=symbiont of Argiope bruennichi TaxID=2810479 RepID=UPI003DA27A38
MKKNLFFLEEVKNYNRNLNVFFSLKIKKNDLLFWIYKDFSKKIFLNFSKGNFKKVNKELNNFLNITKKLFIFYFFKENNFSFFYGFSKIDEKNNILCGLKFLVSTFSIKNFGKVYFIYQKNIFIKKQNQIFYQKINQTFASFENKKHKLCLGFKISKNINLKFRNYQNELLQITYQKLNICNFQKWKNNFEIFKGIKNKRFSKKLIDQIFEKKILLFYKKDQILSFRKVAFFLLKKANNYLSFGKYSLGFDSRYYFNFFKNPQNKLYNPENFFKAIKYFQSCNPYEQNLNLKKIINFKKKFKAIQKKLYYHFLLSNKKKYFKFLKRYYLGYDSDSFFSKNFSDNNKYFCINKVKEKFNYFESIDPYEQNINYFYISYFFKSNFILNFRNHQLLLFKKHLKIKEKEWEKILDDPKNLEFNSSNCNYFLNIQEFDPIYIKKKFKNLNDNDPFIKKFSKKDIDNFFQKNFTIFFYFHQKKAYQSFLKQHKQKYYYYFLGYQKWYDPLKKFHIKKEFSNFDFAKIIYLFLNLEKISDKYSFLQRNKNFNFLFQNSFQNNFFIFQKKYKKQYAKELIKLYRDPGKYNFLFTEKSPEIQKIYDVSFSSQKLINFLKDKEITDFWLRQFDPFLNGQIFLKFFELQIKYLKFYLFYLLNWFFYYKNFQLYKTYKRKISYILSLIKTNDLEKLKKYNYYFLKKNYTFFHKSNYLTYFSKDDKTTSLLSLYWPKNCYLFSDFYFKKYHIDYSFSPNTIKNLLLSKKNDEILNLYQRDSINYSKFWKLQYKIQSLYIYEILNFYQSDHQNYKGFGVIKIDNIFKEKILSYLHIFPLSKNNFLSLKKFCYLNSYFLYYQFLSKQYVIFKYFQLKKTFFYDEQNFFSFNIYGNYLTYKPLNLNFSKWSLLDKNALKHLNYHQETYKVFLKEQKKIKKTYENISKKDKKILLIFIYIFLKDKIFNFEIKNISLTNINSSWKEVDNIFFENKDKKYLVFLPKFLFILIFEVSSKTINFFQPSNFKSLIYINFLENKIIETKKFFINEKTIQFLEGDNTYEILKTNYFDQNYFSFISCPLIFKIKKNNQVTSCFYSIKSKKNNNYFDYFATYKNIKENYFKNYKIVGFFDINCYFLLKNEKDTFLYNFDFNNTKLKKYSYFEAKKIYHKLLKNKNIIKRTFLKRKLKKFFLKKIMSYF